jgi:hypothetical protein
MADLALRRNVAAAQRSARRSSRPRSRMQSVWSRCPASPHHVARLPVANRHSVSTRAGASRDTGGHRDCDASRNTQRVPLRADCTVKKKSNKFLFAPSLVGMRAHNRVSGEKYSWCITRSVRVSNFFFLLLCFFFVFARDFRLASSSPRLLHFFFAYRLCRAANTFVTSRARRGHRLRLASASYEKKKSLLCRCWPRTKHFANEEKRNCAEQGGGR